MSHPTEEQWEYVTTTKQDGRVYQMGDKFKYVDRGLDDLDAFDDAIAATKAACDEVNRIENKLKEQGIDLFIKETYATSKGRL